MKAGFGAESTGMTDMLAAHDGEVKQWCDAIVSLQAEEASFERESHSWLLSHMSTPLTPPPPALLELRQKKATLQNKAAEKYTMDLEQGQHRQEHDQVFPELQVGIRAVCT